MSYSSINYCGISIWKLKLKQKQCSSLSLLISEVFYNK